jgi:hypothetical protein
MQYSHSTFAECTGYAQYHNLSLTSPALLAYAQAQIASRLALCDAIRFVGVPWGLMPLLAPLNPRFVPLQLQDECHFLNLHHEVQWDMQCRYLHAQVRAHATIMGTSLWATNRTLAPGIPVLDFGM